MDYQISLNGNKTDFELALNDLFGTIEVILDDIQNLKLKAYEPTKIEAKIFLDYFTWEENSNPKKNFEAIYAKELELLHEWLKIYCKLHKCSREEALERVIEE